MHDVLSYQIVTWVLIIAGWVIINKQHNARELRKEIRLAIDNLKDDVHALEGMAIDYHSNKPSERTALTIKQSIESIEFNIELHHLMPLSIKNERVIDLRKAITLNNFQTSSYQPQTINSPIIQDIAFATSQLLQSMERNYRVHYPV